MSTRRDALEPVKHNQAQHAGLWLDKFLADQQDGTRSILVDETSKIPVPAIYRHFFERWEQALRADPTVITEQGRVRGRLLVGLGAESVIETNVSLHHTYGVPYIPGSALKGVAAAYARQRLDERWKKPEQPWDPATAQAGPTPYEILFGSTSTAGYVTFHDALYRPGTGVFGRPLHPDVLTVHHQTYYNASPAEVPADWDDPIPVSLLSATGSYLIALGGPAAWVTVALDILALALHELGVGAKTSSGYGRMELGNLARAQQQVGPMQRAVDEQPQQTLESLAAGAQLTGRVERESTRISFKGQRTLVFRVTANPKQLERFALPEQAQIELFITDPGAKGSSGRFELVEQDNSDAGVIRWRVVKAKKAA